jgi:ABC-type branched-subunit amino acid transport system substrate-binding protein
VPGAPAGTAPKAAAPAAAASERFATTNKTATTKSATSAVAKETKVSAPVKPAAVTPSASGAGGSESDTEVKGAPESAADAAANQKIYDQKNGATDFGVTKDAIQLGSINMHGMALGNVIVDPEVRSNLAAAHGVNDRGGILGRRIEITDCDDGPGEVARAKACIKKLVADAHVFSMITGIDWATASIHDDLAQYHLPYIGAWAYSQTEWQDPFMFPTHMSMIHEAMAGAHWAVDVVHPKTYGLICLTSPEMQLACNEVARIMDANGAKLVRRADVSISETSMSAYVLAMRAANPDHIIHYVINPATITKFFVEAGQQGYWPPMGISGNHLATEVLGSLFGKYPAGRYWTNTTYKLWGSEYMALMHKYARANNGLNHHITQAGYMAINMFALAGKAIGPNLTRQRMMAELGNGTVWRSDAGMDQKFSYVPAERGQGWDTQGGQGREFMYKYASDDTVSSPDGSPNGFQLDRVIYTSK